MKRLISSLALLGAITATSYATPAVQIRLPERFRVLTGQLFDLRVEATGVSSIDSANVRILADGHDITSTLGAPEVTSDNDANATDPDKAWTFRAIQLSTTGVHSLVAEVTDSSGSGTFEQRVGVQDFSLVETMPGHNKKHTTFNHIPPKNIILYIGDAMGTAYRDAGRIVAKSTGNRFRQGFFDELQQMDSMPVNGMVMTYALDRIVPDSANTATAWASGNKTVDGMLNVFPDNNDFRVNTSAATLQATKKYALDNPRVETLWQYLKRNYGYKTGIVSTADIADATPAGEGGYSLLRSLTFDIAKQYVDGAFGNGPEFDVILGGGMEHFNKRTATNSGDTRDLTLELQSAGFTYVTSRSALNGLNLPPDRLLGLFYSQAGAAGNGTVSNTGASGNMNVAYDKLGIVRPSDEQGSNASTPTNAPNFNGFNDQPFLDEMTSKAIATLSKDGAPFILMVEGASIDKQSHPNHEAGVVWDVIEFDKAIGLGRSFAGATNHTLVLVTADHDQSLSIVGVTDTAITGAVLNTRSYSIYPKTGANKRTEYDPTLNPPGVVGPSAGAQPVAPQNFGNNAGEVVGFPDYAEGNFNGGVYPNNNNEFKLAVGFRTGNHTGSSVPLTAEGPGALLFAGYYDQTDIFFKMARVISSNTTALDQFLGTKDRYHTIDQNY